MRQTHLSHRLSRVTLRVTRRVTRRATNAPLPNLHIYKSDGFVPTWFVAGWPKGPQLAAQLVSAHLWEPAARDDELGWQFHDWDDVQMTALEIEAARDFSRERQRRYRANRAAQNGHGA